MTSNEKIRLIESIRRYKSPPEKRKHPYFTYWIWHKFGGIAPLYERWEWYSTVEIFNTVSDDEVQEAYYELVRYWKK